MRWLIGAVIPMLWATGSAWAQMPKVVAEEIGVPHGEGIEIYVRSKRPEGVARFTPDRIAIMMHGARYPSDADRGCSISLDALTFLATQ